MRTASGFTVVAEGLKPMAGWTATMTMTFTRTGDLPTGGVRNRAPANPAPPPTPVLGAFPPG